MNFYKNYISENSKMSINEKINFRHENRCFTYCLNIRKQFLLKLNCSMFLKPYEHLILNAQSDYLASCTKINGLTRFEYENR